MNLSSAGSAAAGYALGVGLVSVACLGIPARFLFPEIAPLLTYGGALLVGTIAGALHGFWRRSAERK